MSLLLYSTARLCDDYLACSLQAQFGKALHTADVLLRLLLLLLLLLLLQKHKEVKVKLVKRTKKNQRKTEHRARMAEKVQLLLGDQVMADAPGAAAGSSKRIKKLKYKKKAAQGGAGASDVAAAAAEVMQE
jgi:hypothetical protein